VELFSGMAQGAWLNKWESCIYACEEYAKFVARNHCCETACESMQLRIKANYLWAEELRKQAANHRDEAMHMKDLGDHASAFKAHESAISDDQSAAQVMMRLMVAHQSTDCVFAKLGLDFHELSAESVSQNRSEQTVALTRVDSKLQRDSAVHFMNEITKFT